MSWMNIYWVIHYFVEGGGLVDLLVKSVHLSNLCCIMCQWWPLKKMGKEHFKFFLQSLHACYSKSIKKYILEIRS